MSTIESQVILIDRCVDLVRDRAPKIYARWKPAHLRSYFEFHGWQGTAAVYGLHSIGQRPATLHALAVGWRCQSSIVRSPEFLAAPWRFSVEDPQGDAFYVDLLVARNRAAVTPLVAELQWRLPNWRRLQFLIHRRGKLRRYDPEKFLNRLEAP